MEWLTSWKSTASGEGQGVSAFHIHDRCEILTVCEGQIRMQIGGDSYTLSPHQLVVIRPLEVHNLYPTAYPYTRIGLHVPDAFLSRAGIAPALSSVLRRRGEAAGRLFTLTGHPETERLIAELHEEASGDRPGRAELLGVLFHALLLRLYRIQPAGFPAGSNDPRMEEARRYVEEHFAEPLPLAGLAARFYCSPSHFIACFRQYTGYTPQQYKKLCRVARARYLLLDTDYSLPAIAEACGFSDENAFVRCFRQTMQIPPGRFRRLSLEKSQTEWE